MPNLTIKQSQRQQMKLSPRQELKIKILQLSNLQLVDKIQEELLQNPVLEEGDSSNLYLPIVDPVEIKEDIKRDEINWEEFFEYSKNPMIYESTATEEVKPIYENIPTPQPTLREYLLRQLSMVPLSSKEYEIGEMIIDNINEDGYFSSSVDIIAKSMKVSVKEVERVLSKIQEFEPTGVAARNLKECLLIQAKELGLDSLVPLIKNHLSDISNKKYDQIAKKMNISIEQVKELIDMMKLLEPKPVRLYEKSQSSQIIPEIIISNTKEEGLKLEINDEWLPSLRISHCYKKLLKKGKLSPAENDYIQKKIKAALFFLECIKKRKETLEYVAKIIFDRQKEFLQEGVSKLVPMKLEDVAKEVNLHLSTVSRAIANKFVKTPYGVYPLKFFFTTGIQTEEGNHISASTVKERIKEIIDQEDKHMPLSDNKIALLLREQGINIATRTVAKYREELNIPSSFARKI